MGVFLIKLICPVMLAISIAYPFIRGWKRVKWLKSVAIGWAIFLLGSLFREYLSPWLAEVLIGPEARTQIQCLNSYLVLGIALGWIFPVIFHFLGSYLKTKSDHRLKKKSA